MPTTGRFMAGRQDGAMLDPIATSDATPLYRLQGLDRSLIGGSGLYFASNRPALAANAGTAWHLHPGDWLGGGTLRHSFYAEPWLRFTRVRDLCLRLVVRGSVRLRVMRAQAGHAASVLKELWITQAELGSRLVPLGGLQDLPPGTRLFWHIEAVGAGAELRDIDWCTRQAPAGAESDGASMAVLMRTFGRGDELRALLRRWQDQAADDAHLRRALARLDLWVLDATPGAAQCWPDPSHAALNLRVWSAPNLGGGGNASHLIHLFLAAMDAAGREPAETLILDDDLAVSLETLARQLAFGAYRERDSLNSLPVLMKSRMTTVWEDGGLWGTDALPPATTHAGQPQRRLEPRLLRHGLVLDGFEHLDGFGALNHCEYTTFIFLALPTRCLRRIGLPAAFFLRGDDIEFCLRARTLGLPVWTNPNLVAWHEPGHSPAQEYMAVLHGVLTNLRHADNPAEDYARFFEQRVAEHAAIDDLQGMALYLQVLLDLLDENSALLTPGFARHYLDTLPRWAPPPQVPLAEAERLRLTASHLGAGDITVLPFAHPGHHPRVPGRARQVWLRLPGAETAWAVPPASLEQRLALQQLTLQALRAWLVSFAPLRERWVARLQACGTPAFWQAVHDQHAAETVLLHTATAAASAPIDPAHGAAAAQSALQAEDSRAAELDIGELRERLTQELAHWQVLRRRAEREAAAGSRWRRWAPWLRRPTLSGSEPAQPALPADWDERQYLALNQDVARSGVDPALHYLRHGRIEGRRYRA
jgi:hypothetical protein